MRAIKNIALSLIITVIIVLSVFFSRGILPGIWQFIYGHGIFPYLIIFFALWSLLDSISDEWKFNRLGILPGLIGIFSIISGLQTLFAALSYLMRGDEWAPTIVLFGTAVWGLSPSFDMLALGCGLSLLLFAICTSVIACQKKPQ